MRELKRLVRLRRVTCRRSGTDRYGRFLGTCWAHPILWGSKVDLSAAMVSSGHAIVYRQDPLLSANNVQLKQGQRVVSGGCCGPIIPMHMLSHAILLLHGSRLCCRSHRQPCAMLCCQSYLVWKVIDADTLPAQALQGQRTR